MDDASNVQANLAVLGPSISKSKNIERSLEANHTPEVPYESRMMAGDD
jgi:hypothetical protein